MAELADALDQLVAKLRTAGIAASTDGRDLNPPCAWVTVHDITTPVLCGGIEVRADVCLIAGDAGSPQSVAALSDLLDLALTVVVMDEPARPMAVRPPGVGTAIPALVLTTVTH